jgi:antitoxin component of MazEF toxin-antitoxin module
LTFTGIREIIGLSDYPIVVLNGVPLLWRSTVLLEVLMNELFRLRIAAKRQMTAPQRLMDALSLSEGDELQVEVAGGQILSVHACKSVPTSLLSDDLLSEIKRQEHRLAQGKGLTAEAAMREVEKQEKRPAVGRKPTEKDKRRKSVFETQMTPRMSS